MQGSLTQVLLRKSKNGKAWATFDLEDETGCPKVLCFWPAYAEHRGLIVDGHRLVVRATLGREGDEEAPTLVLRMLAARAARPH